MTDLQKASFGKRIVAGILDGILISILAVGLAALLSGILGYDNYMNTVNEAYARYESEYGVEFQINEEQYEALTEDQRTNWDTAYKALTEDKEVNYAYNMLINLTMVILTSSVLLSVIVIEFVVPLLFGNGQTLGKKIFGIALMHIDGIKVSSVQLFARAVLGKFAIELMIPLSIIMMVFFNMMGVVGIIILAALLIAQIACLAITRTNALIHDVLASTVAVDMASQQIFDTREALLEHTKKIHAEQASRSTY